MPSSAHIRARFTAPNLNNTGSNLLATGNSNNSTPRNSYQLQHGTTLIDPISLNTRYGSSTVNGPHLAGIASDATRQAVILIFKYFLCKKNLAIKTIACITNCSAN